LTVSPNTSPSESTTGPKVKPMRTARRSAGRFAGVLSAASCMSHAARQASSEFANAHTMPSPSFFTTVPPWVAAALPSSHSSWSISVCACASPSDS